MRTLYSVMLVLAIPLILARLFWRGFTQSGYRENVGERFGRYPQPRTERCIWIHAVSVGETRAAQPLIDNLSARYPGYSILLTCMTPTGRATAREVYGEAVYSAYLPYDLVTLHQHLIVHFRPVMLLIMETEIWPNLLHACGKNAIPALLVNARLSEKSWRAYNRVAPVRALARQALQSMRVVGAQSVADAERIGALGAASIVITGNMKFDIELSPALQTMGESWRALLGGRKGLLCASTREGEETLLLNAYVDTFDANARRNILLIIVPRHPQRFDQVAEQIGGAGLRLTRRSQGMTTILLEPADVLLGDSMGEMAAYYALCDTVIMGGSLLPLGGQNLIEACALGKPVIMGPSTFNFAEVARLAQDAGAMQAVADAAGAMRTAMALLNDSPRRHQMSDAGRQLVEGNRGATEKTMALIAPLLGTN